MLDFHLINHSRQRKLRLATFAMFAILLAGFTKPSVAVEYTTIRLWEKDAPGTPVTKPQDEPKLYLRLPTVPSTGTAVIILPGGGYGALAMTYEGLDVGDWFASLGVTAFVLKYRMNGTG